MAVDDGAFRRGDREAPIAAVVVSAPDYVEAVGLSTVRVDGVDGTRRVLALVRAVRPPEGVRALLLDGAVVGGFNVLDLDLLHDAVGVPLVALTRRRPDFPRIRAALVKWFPRSAGRRYSLLSRHRLFRVPTGGEPVWAAAVGCPRPDAVLLVRRTTVRGYWPEPLRLAHLVASAGAAGRRPSERTLKGRVRRSTRGPVA
ncbi:MAG TPA: DUF99 family protein [Thermoplasmata archaeon]|nr:DUF99 family protein [Thermoplasmata archaeon]